MTSSQKYLEKHRQWLPLAALKESFYYDSVINQYGKICELEGMTNFLLWLLSKEEMPRRKLLRELKNSYIKKLKKLMK